MRQLRSIIAISIALSFGSENIYSKDYHAYLLPSINGEPSKVVSADMLSVISLIQYDCGESNDYLTDLLPGDTIGVLFVPPVPCSLLEVHFCRYNRCEDSPTTYFGFVVDVPDTVTLESFEEYHDTTSMPGPSPIGDYYVRPTAMDIPSARGWCWDTLVIPGEPNIGQDAFWAGYTIEDTCQSTKVDLGVPPPYLSICWKQSGAGPEANGPGWYSSSHLPWIRALVKFCEPNFTGVTLERLKGTYDTHDRLVHIYSWDFNEDTSGLGFYPDSAFLYYTIEECNTRRVALIQDSVYSPDPYTENAWWHAVIPGQRPEVKVTYWAELEYRSELRPLYKTRSYGYKVKSIRRRHSLLYIEEDESFGSGKDIHNAFPDNFYNVWNENLDGHADNSVMDYYITGAGFDEICWLSPGGEALVDFTNTQIFEWLVDAGGSLLISSQDLIGSGFNLGYGEWEAPESPNPLRDYFKAYAGIDDYITESPVTVFVDNTDIVTCGVPDEITLDCTLLYPTWFGVFTELDAECMPLFYSSDSKVLGYRYESYHDYRLLFLYFPLHSITDPEVQDILVRNFHDWSGVGVERTSETEICKFPRVSPTPLSNNMRYTFLIEESMYVKIYIYDIKGSLIGKLVDEKLNVGEHSIKINTEGLSSGVYFLRMEAGGFSGTEKFLVVR